MKLNEIARHGNPNLTAAIDLLDKSVEALEVLHEYGSLDDRAKASVASITKLVLKAQGLLNG